MTQTEIPGTERVDIPELVARAEAYKQVVAERLAIQKVEAERKAELIAEIHECLEEGLLSVDPDAEGVIPVYRYTDDEGVARKIKFGSVEKVSVVNDSGDE